MRLLCLGENWDTAALGWLLWRKLTCEEVVGAWSARSLPQPEKLEWDLAGVMPAKKLSRAFLLTVISQLLPPRDIPGHFHQASLCLEMDY